MVIITTSGQGNLAKAAPSDPTQWSKLASPCGVSRGIRDKPTDGRTCHISNNSLHLMHSVQPNNDNDRHIWKVHSYWEIALHFSDVSQVTLSMWWLCCTVRLSQPAQLDWRYGKIPGKFSYRGVHGLSLCQSWEVTVVLCGFSVCNWVLRNVSWLIAECLTVRGMFFVSYA